MYRYLRYSFHNVARLNFPAEKATFRIQDNPLIHALDEKLQAAQTSSVKLLFDYLRSEEYREYVRNFYLQYAIIWQISIVVLQYDHSLVNIIVL